MNSYEARDDAGTWMALDSHSDGRLDVTLEGGPRLDSLTVFLSPDKARELVKFLASQLDSEADDAGTGRATAPSELEGIQ